MTVVLAFDTATSATVACAMAPGGGLAERRDDAPPGGRPRHVQRLVALCEEALTEIGAGWDDVTRIGVGVGPGTFTGLRIGVATARALATALPAEVVPVSSLEALALGAAPAEDVLAVIDARRGEAFAAAFRSGHRQEPAAALAPDALAALAGPGRIAVGDGAVRYRAALADAGIAVPPDADARHRVAGGPLARLALAGAPVPVATLVPDYVRLPDAELHRRRVAADP